MRLAAAPIELRNPEHEPPPRARGIAVGVLLGAAIWAAIVALGVAIWRWITG
jgi:fatty acid desaturase